MQNSHICAWKVGVTVFQWIITKTHEKRLYFTKILIMVREYSASTAEQDLMGFLNDIPCPIILQPAVVLILHLWCEWPRWRPLYSQLALHQVFKQWGNQLPTYSEWTCDKWPPHMLEVHHVHFKMSPFSTEVQWKARSLSNEQVMVMPG